MILRAFGNPEWDNSSSRSKLTWVNWPCSYLHGRHYMYIHRQNSKLHVDTFLKKNVYTLECLFLFDLILYVQVYNFSVILGSVILG